MLKITWECRECQWGGAQEIREEESLFRVNELLKFEHKIKRQMGIPKPIACKSPKIFFTVEKGSRRR